MQDVITDIFSELRLQSKLYFQAEFRGNFGVAIPDEKRLVRFHFIRSGQCVVDIPNSEEFLLSPGDLIIIPNGSAQNIKAHRHSQCHSLSSVIASSGIHEGNLKYGSGESMVQLLCGYCQYDESLDHPLLKNLQTVVLQPNQPSMNVETQATLLLLSTEVQRNAAGMTGVLSRLLEILFIQSFRETAQSRDALFFEALSDHKIGSALSIIHKNYQKNWTLTTLALQVGMSRARFADKFTKLVGLPAITYLTKWRLLKSRAMLANTTVSLEIISERCGYTSLPAFSRRFKEEFKQTPSNYRKEQRRFNT